MNRKEIIETLFGLLLFISGYIQYCENQLFQERLNLSQPTHYDMIPVVYNLNPEEPDRLYRYTIPQYTLSLGGYLSDFLARSAKEGDAYVTLSRRRLFHLSKSVQSSLPVISTIERISTLSKEISRTSSCLEIG